MRIPPLLVLQAIGVTLAVIAGVRLFICIDFSKIQGCVVMVVVSTWRTYTV